MFVGWCEEGLVYPNAEEYGQRKLDRRAFDRLQSYFTWGQNQTDDMTRLLAGRGSEKLLTTGNPRLDLHRRELRGIFDGEVAAIRARYGEFILVNTRFSRSNHIESADAAMEMALKSGRLPSGEDQARASAMVDFQARLFPKFVDLIAELSRSFPERRIVIRPHPREKLQTWEELARAWGNVEVLLDGNVAAWILAASVSVQNNCTTGVEAYLLDRPTIAFRPMRDERYDLHLPNAVSANATKIEEVVTMVRSALADGSLPTAAGGDDLSETVRHYIANRDGPLATHRILDAIDGIDVDEKAVEFEVPRRGMREFLKGGLFGRAPVKRDKGGDEKMSLQQDELQGTLAQMRRVTGRYNSVNVVTLGKNTVGVFA